MSIQSNFPNLKPSLLLDFANTKQLDNRITFTRSTPAVYYDGKTTAMAEQNLLTYSQNSATNWTQANTTANTSATTAPDGTSTAISLVPSTLSTDEHLFYQTFTGTEQPYTHSVYAKANGYDWVYLRPQIGSSLAWANFNLSTGTIGTVSSGVTATITSVGNGWYRCTATRTQSTGANYMVIGVANADNHPTFAGNGTSSIYIWGAQLEQRSAATAYTPTTTQPITNYIPVLLTAGGNQARFDCNPTTGESLGLLIEEQRTNICLYSGAIGTGTWGGLSPSIVAIPNTAVAPNGTVTATQLILASGGGGYYVTTGQTITIGQPYTLSCWMRTDTGTKTIGIGGVNGFSNGSCTVTTTWQRFTFTGTSANGFEYFGFDSRITGGSTSGFVYVWGYQVEAASFATSYIATTSASATRTADLANMTGTNFTSWFNNAEGTMYSETSLIGANGYNGVLRFSDGTINNRFGLYSFPSADYYGVVMSAIGTTQA